MFAASYPAEQYARLNLGGCTVLLDNFSGRIADVKGFALTFLVCLTGVDCERTFHIFDIDRDRGPDRRDEYLTMFEWRSLQIFVD